MHTFSSLSGTKYSGCVQVPVKAEDGSFRTAFEIANAAITGQRIVLLEINDDGNSIKLFKPSDIVNKRTDFVVVNIADKTIESCAKEGLIDVAKWLLAYKCGWGERTISDAVSGGHIEFAKWAYENRCPWGKVTMAMAAQTNNIEFAKWAHSLGCPWHSGCTIAHAAGGGHIKFAKWAYANGCPLGDNVLDFAACGGHIKFAKWALKNGYSWKNSVAIHMAKNNGHFEFVEWAMANGCADNY